MKNVNPYLNFRGNTEEAFNFYRTVFGGEFLTVMRFKDTPEGDRVPAHERDKIMHIGLPIGNGTILMATDALESMGHKIQPGNNFHISIDADTKAEADILFKKLSGEGTVVIPMDKMFWGSYFGMCTDKFGIQWMISFDEKAG